MSMYPWNGVSNKRSGRPRVLVDNNVWRYVVDARAGGRLALAARDGAYDVQIAPSVVYEALRTRDPALRKALVSVMTDRRFVRLMPEAYSESMEILREIERLHPAWLRTSPNREFVRRLEADWRQKTSGFWVRCATAPEAEADRLSQGGDGVMMHGARAQAENARQEIRDVGWKKSPAMDEIRVSFSEPRAGWAGDTFEPWRMDGLAGLTYALSRRGSAYRDWIASFVTIENGLLSSAEWLRFWVYEADETRMPRQWMRWAHAFSQRFRKVTPGTPADTQLATYFFDTDLVVSADKALLDTLEECRPYSPCPLPAGKLIEGGVRAVEPLLAFLKTNA
ncbi:MAG: hypothetical protein EOP84_00675 [Verrucomicrobiaceae bacterium]|nr:MAG: hypothetical protein EOP84_00675 [Verrucomicrobiaceae bacterium]